MTITDTLMFSDMKVIYSPSEEISFYIQQKMQEKLKNTTENRLTVETEKELKNAVSSMSVAPLASDYWITNVRYNPKKISQKVIDELWGNRYDYGTMVIWVKDYKDLMRLTGSKAFSRYKQYVPVIKFSFLDIDDMKAYYSEKVPEEFRLEEELFSFVLKNYRFDPKAFADLVSFLIGGKEFKTIKDLIEEVGLGRSSVESLVFKLLSTSTTTKKGVQRLYAESIRYIENLKAKYDYKTIVNFINYNLDTLIEIKQLQIRGLYNNAFIPLPDGHDKERIMRMRRYNSIILNKISLLDALNLRLAFMKAYHNDSRVHIMTALSYYVDYLYAQGGGDAGEEERERLRQEKKEKAKRSKEELQREMEEQLNNRRSD